MTDLEQVSGEPGDQPHDSRISLRVKAGQRVQNASPESWLPTKRAIGTRLFTTHSKKHPGNPQIQSGASLNSNLQQLGIPFLHEAPQLGTVPHCHHCHNQPRPGMVSGRWHVESEWHSHCCPEMGGTQNQSLSDLGRQKGTCSPPGSYNFR